MKEKIASIMIGMLLFATAYSVAGTMNFDKDKTSIEAYSNSIPSNNLLAPGDVLYTYDVQTPTGDNGCLGVEFDGTYFWVTGRNSPGGDIHKLHKFDSDGNHIISYDQGTVSTWGWRDLAWDGEYLYGSDEDEFVKIDPADGTVAEVLTKPAGLTVCRGLAVNPENGHFFSANWGSPIFEFDPNDGTVFKMYDNTLSIYGLAYDDATPGGPFLWVYSQDGVNDTVLVQISQFDIDAGVYTGLTYEGVYEPSADQSLAGGCAFYTEGDKGIMVGCTQTDPDTVFGMEVSDISGPPPANLEIGEISGGLLKVKAVIKNTGIGDAENVDCKIALDGGLIIVGKTTNDIIISIAAGEEETVSSGLIFGIGKSLVTVTAEIPESLALKDVNATVLLFFIKI
jgi:hypothetical protein